MFDFYGQGCRNGQNLKSLRGLSREELIKISISRLNGDTLSVSTGEILIERFPTDIEIRRGLIFPDRVMYISRKGSSLYVDGVSLDTCRPERRNPVQDCLLVGFGPHSLTLKKPLHPNLAVALEKYSDIIPERLKRDGRGKNSIFIFGAGKFRAKFCEEWKYYFTALGHNGSDWVVSLHERFPDGEDYREDVWEKFS